MGPAAPQPTLNYLRQTLAGIDPSNAPRLAGEERLIGIVAPINRALGGGLAAARCMNSPPRRPCISGLRVDLAWRWRRGPAATAVRSFGSPPISRRARAADPMAPVSICSAWPRRGC